MKPQSIYPFLSWLSIFLIILSPQLFSEGMFMDGVYYATVARNMSEGIGSLWVPTLTDTIGIKFYEHPPLGFGLQSIFFSIFGDHFWVERFYSLVTYIITALLMLRFWKMIVGRAMYSYGLVSLFLWITVPKIIWGASANLLENTSMIFILASIYFQLKAFIEERKFPLFLAGLFILLAFLTKGITALFPLSFPFFYRLTRKELNRVFLDYLFLIGSIAICFFALIILQPISWDSINHYFEIQVLGSLQNPATEESRFYIINRFMQEITVILILLAIVIGLHSWKFKNDQKISVSPYFWPIILCALSGILPIMLSLKQSTFYIIPTFSLICLAVSLLIAPRLKKLMNKFEEGKSMSKLWRVLALILLPIAMISNAFFFGRLNRDKAMLTDIKKIVEIAPERTVLQIHPSMLEQYAYYAYFYRYGKISLSTEKGDYLLTPIHLPDNSKAKNSMNDLQLKTLVLYDQTNQ